jgi:branched-chain amino acid transport system permease protein
VATVAQRVVEGPHEYLQAQSRWRWPEMAFWIATLLPFVLFPSYLQLASQIAITALFAVSLDLILGYAGIVSLGHAAFFGLGAYAAGLISKFGWGEPLSGLVIAAALAGGVGYAASFVIARFRHLALIMLTLGMCLLLFEAANSASWLTGGADGLQGVRMRPLFERFPFDLWGRTAYTYSLLVLFLTFLVARRLIHSPFGLSLRGIRENATRMPALGAPSRAHLRKIYTIAAVMAGIAGALLAQTTSTVSLEVLSFQRSADVLVILILGGSGRLYGGILGAIIYMVARDQFSGINPQYWYFWIGLLLIAVVMFLPNGILGGLGRLASAWPRPAR